MRMHQVSMERSRPKFLEMPREVILDDFKGRLARHVGQTRAEELVDRYNRVRPCPLDTLMFRLERVQEIVGDKKYDLPWGNLIHTGTAYERLEKAALNKAGEKSRRGKLLREIDELAGKEVSEKYSGLKTIEIERIPGRMREIRQKFGEGKLNYALESALLSRRPSEYSRWIESTEKLGKKYDGVIEALGEVFSEDEARKYISKSGLSPENMLARIARLKADVPDWQELLETRSTILSCSNDEFETRITSFLMEKNEPEFEKRMLEEFSGYPASTYEKLRRCKAASLVSAEAVCDRIEEIRALANGMRLPKEKAWLLVTSSPYFNKWLNRIRTYKTAIDLVSGCTDPEVAGNFINFVLRSDARFDSKMKRAGIRLQELYEMKGGSAVQDALIGNKKALYYEDDWEKRINGEKLSRSCPFQLHRRFARTYSTQGGIKVADGFVILAGGIGIRMDKNDRIARTERSLLVLYMKLFLTGKERASRFAHEELRKPKSISTHSKLKLVLIKEYANQRMDFKVLGKLEKIEIRVPDHRDYVIS